MPLTLDLEYATDVGRMTIRLYLRSDGEDEHFHIYATPRKSDTPEGPLISLRFPKVLPES